MFVSLQFKLELSERFAPLKPILMEEMWDRVRNRLAPLSAGRRPDEGFLEQPHCI
jgi:hypothetical protein